MIFIANCWISVQKVELSFSTNGILGKETKNATNFHKSQETKCGEVTHLCISNTNTTHVFIPKFQYHRY